VEHEAFTSLRWPLQRPLYCIGIMILLEEL
jgi:hypothetical protein